MSVTIQSDLSLCDLSDCNTSMCVEVRGLHWVYPADGRKHAKRVAKIVQTKYPDSEVRIVSTAHLIKERQGDDFISHIVPAGTFQRQNPKPKWTGPHNSSDFTTCTHDEPHQNSRTWGPGEREAAKVKKQSVGERARKKRQIEKVADSIVAELFG